MSVPFYLSYIALWILVVFQGIILLGMVRMVYQLQRDRTATGVPEGSSEGSLKPGQQAPEFTAMDILGRQISSTDFSGRLTALLFVSPSCQTCMATLNEVQALSYKAEGNVVVVCRAEQKGCVQLTEKYNLNMPVVVDADEHVSRIFGISSVPTAVLINVNNNIQSFGQPLRGKELEEMFGKASEAEAQAQGVG